MVFNKDFTQVALSKKDNLIYIYSVKDIMKPDTWQLLHTLDAHAQYVSGLDWNAHTNDILSCSHDKTSFVWEFSDNKWTPSNVVATTKLGYLCCKWNSRGDKFCEGTSAKHLFIGYYNTESKWWMGRNIKVHHSSVVCCEIDPTSLFVISGSTDLRVYVSSCYLPEVDDNHLTAETKPLAQKFGSAIYEFRPNCWLNSVTWTPSGKLGLAAGHNSTIAVIDYKNQKTDVIKCKHAPVSFLIPSGETSFYAVCYDRNILEYEKKGDNWDIKKTVTIETGKKSAPAAGGRGSAVSDALKKFQTMGNQKKESLAVTAKQFSHLHQSIISSVNIKGKDMITTDVSGFVKYWKL
jgi:actin related protein 2/3 complex subunit 1A/1B